MDLPTGIPVARTKDPIAGLVTPAPSHSDAEIIAALTAMPAQDWAVLTGAGLSTDSGIPDYRGPNSPKRNPMTYQEFTSDARKRTRYWARSYIGWARVHFADPNAGHLALAHIRPHGIITQNVDGLHEQATARVTPALTARGTLGAEGTMDTSGTPADSHWHGLHADGIIDLHGRLDRVVCLDCRRMYDRQWVQDRLTELNPGFIEGLSTDPETLETAPDGDVALEETDGFQLLPCPVCAGVLKPDVVFFGENVPRERAQAATDLADAARGLVVLGSSLAVFSGRRFVKRAAAAGKPIIIVTDGPTRGDELATYRSTSRVGEFLLRWQTALSSGNSPL